MQGQQLKLAGNDYIAQDLRRLKKIKSLTDDLEDIFDLVQGLIDETGWPPRFDFCGGLITQFTIEGEKFLCFKERVPTSNPPLSPSNGCRIIYALGVSSKAYVPLLVYRASEEKTGYAINNKQFKLTSINLGKIINERLT